MIDKFLIGCCYYPEHWDEGNLAGDLVRIKGLGFNCIRMGEFSWIIYEKEEGKYDFSLLEKAVRLAGELDICVILGTPTAAPPVWLTQKHPEVLARDKNGVLLEHGGRQHHNHTSEIYLTYCERITEAMVRHFSTFNNVIGWQIDNELNCHRQESYNESDDIAFRIWLAEKYKTTDALNAAWGNKFWSLEFNDFEQITCPRPAPAYRNPSWCTDYYLFLSDTVVNYAARQTKIIRKYMPDAFITHNGWFDNVDYRELTDKCLDFLSFDSYPAFHEKTGLALGRNAAYKLALTRGCSSDYMILEQQSGPGGQLSYLLPTPLPGQIRLWTYQSIAHGAVGLLYFRYRTALYGAEQLWYGIFGHDGEENYRSKEIRAISEELNRVGGLFLRNKIKPEVAIYYDYHNQCINKTESFAADDSRSIFIALNKKNIHADFISRDDDLSGYKVVIVPHITIADKELVEKLDAFAENGGIVIISARSGTKDSNARYLPQKAPGVFRSMAGCAVDWFTSKTDYDDQTVIYNGKEYCVDVYYEMLKPEGGTAVGVYTKSFCKDMPAIVKCGNVYYVGFYVKRSLDLYCDVIRKHLDIREPLDCDVEEISLGDMRMYLNHSNRDIELSGFDILSNGPVDHIPPYGVVLIKEELTLQKDR